MIGRDRGVAMWSSILRWLAPSTRAASNSSSGMACMFDRNNEDRKGLPTGYIGQDQRQRVIDEAHRPHLKEQRYESEEAGYQQEPKIR